MELKMLKKIQIEENFCPSCREDTLYYLFEKEEHCSNGCF